MIYERGGRFCVVVYDASTRKKKWVGTYRDRVTAEAHERDAKERIPAVPTTWDEFAQRWPDDYPRPAKSTNASNRYAVRAFAAAFAGVRLDELDWHAARSWARHQPSNTTDVLRTMFNDAINERLYNDRNPFANLRRPRSRGRKDLEVQARIDPQLLAGAARDVLGAYGEVVFGPLIMFAAYVACRPHELYFLERSEIRGDRALILKADDSTGAPKNPKNNNQREVFVPPPALEAIAKVPPRLDVPWLFTTVNGRRFSKSSLFYYWSRVRSRIGMPDLEFYELRHFGASYMVNVLHLDPADVAIQLGHTDGGALVRTLYGHPSEDAARARIKSAFRAHFGAA